MDVLDWPQEQIQPMGHILLTNQDEKCLALARTTLSEIIQKQDILKRDIEFSNDSGRQLLCTVVERLDSMADHIHRYQTHFHQYSTQLNHARSKTDIKRIVNHIIDETTQIQHQASNAREKLIHTRAQVEHASAKIVALENKIRHMTEQINEDQLTGALNRRGFDSVYARELERSQGNNHPMCLAVIDLDDFRKINQQFGHAGGDAALCHFVAVANTTLHTSASIARFGGEEFVFLMPETTLLDGQLALTQLQLSLQEQSIQHEKSRFRVTCSAGIALRSQNESQEDLLCRADRALFVAKAAGKNQTIRAD